MPSEQFIKQMSVQLRGKIGIPSETTNPATHILQMVETVGATLTIREGQLYAINRNRIPAELDGQIKEHKAALVALFKQRDEAGKAQGEATKDFISGFDPGAPMEDRAINEAAPVAARKKDLPFPATSGKAEAKDDVPAESPRDLLQTKKVEARDREIPLPGFVLVADTGGKEAIVDDKPTKQPKTLTGKRASRRDMESPFIRLSASEFAELRERVNAPFRALGYFEKGKDIQTPRGVGRLEQVFQARIAVVLDGEDKLTFFCKEDGALDEQAEPKTIALAKERQQEHGGTAPGKSKTLPQNFGEVFSPVGPKINETNKQIGQSSGVSHETIRKAKIISEKVPEPIKEKLRRGEVRADDFLLAVQALSCQKRPE